MGEAYVELQRELNRLKNRGILLAISSKNDRENALAAIDTHPEMVLRSTDFCAMEIDWTDKAAHVANILRAVNVGPQSAVFLDDNPSERGRVHEAHPEVLVPSMPDNPLLYVDLLRSLNCFDFYSITHEDLNRTEMIQRDQDRDASQSSFASTGDWLASLEVEVIIETLGNHNLPRVSQLLNKTNQMNLRTRRMAEAEWMNWVREDGNEMYAFRVSDRFGDFGLTGVLGLRHQGDELYVEDFVLSCRVFGKQIEEVMLALASSLSADRRLVFEYVETAKNGPCLRFLERGYLEKQGLRYIRNSGQLFPFPDHVSVIRA
jgi:FkbH-like protein